MGVLASIRVNSLKVKLKPSWASTQRIPIIFWEQERKRKKRQKEEYKLEDHPPTHTHTLIPN